MNEHDIRADPLEPRGDGIWHSGKCQRVTNGLTCPLPEVGSIVRVEGWAELTEGRVERHVDMGIGPEDEHVIVELRLPAPHRVYGWHVMVPTCDLRWSGREDALREIAERADVETWWEGDRLCSRPKIKDPLDGKPATVENLYLAGHGNPAAINFIALMLHHVRGEKYKAEHKAKLKILATTIEDARQKVARLHPEAQSVDLEEAAGALFGELIVHLYESANRPN